MTQTTTNYNAISIVVYEDIINKNKWLAQFFVKYDLSVVMAADGQDLLDKTIEIKPDVVMMDVQMDVISGLDCLRMIRHENQNIRTVLLSDIGSHSIAQSAIGLEVDLYCDKSRRAINVIGFLKKLMGISYATRKHAKPTHSLSGADLSQRKKDRYPVSGAVTMLYDEKEYAGVFENLSLGGAKIRVSQIPPLPSTIELIWTYKDEISFRIKAVTVRQDMVFEPFDEFVWVVGVKFTRLSVDQIKKLTNLLTQISKFYEKKFDFVDFEEIRKMIDREDGYFMPILQGQKAPPLVEKAMKDIKQYERVSFSGNRPQDVVLAKGLALRVTCHLLQQSLNWVKVHQQKGLKASVPLIYEVLQRVDTFEDEFNMWIPRTPDIEEKKELIESSNAILVEKDKLIQSFYRKCSTMQSEMDYKPEFSEILQRYIHLQTHHSYVHTQQEKPLAIPVAKPVLPRYKISKKTKQEKENTQIKKQRDLENQKLRDLIVPTLAAGIVLSILLYHVLNFYNSFVPPNELGIPMAVEKIRIYKLRNMVVQTGESSWEILTPVDKMYVMDQLEVFMTAKGLYQTKIKDGEKILAAVYSTRDLDHLRYSYTIFE